MNVCKEDIMTMKPGQIKPFVCEDAAQMQVAATMLSQTKRLGMPKGVVDFECQKFFDENIILIHALGEDEEKVLNKVKV